MNAAAAGGSGAASLAAEAGDRIRVSGLQMARHIVQVEFLSPGALELTDIARSTQDSRLSSSKPTPEISACRVLPLACIYSCAHPSSADAKAPQWRMNLHQHRAIEESVWQLALAGRMKQPMACGVPARQATPGILKASLICDLQSEGVLGLYRGFGMSIATFVPTSGIWWGAYGAYQKLIWQQVLTRYQGSCFGSLQRLGVTRLASHVWQTTKAASHSSASPASTI